MHLINKITIYSMVGNIERKLRRRSNFLKRVIGALFQVPKSFCYLLVIVFSLNIFSVFNKSPLINKYLAESSLYNNICEEVVIPVTQSKIAKELPNIINDSFKIVIKERNVNDTSNDKGPNNTIIYYNGVTLEEGVRSNNEIDQFARSLVQNESSTSEKAKVIYYWISKNLDYDEDKANKVLNDDFNVESGAIPAFQTRKGICFDYSCLYVAMCRANGVKVRLVTGEGFNGVSWVGHAWNQVYLKEEDRWINVDTTFAKGGNYFDSMRFQRDHKNPRLAGEW